VKAKLKEGATTDAFTGAVPNDDFGWGKVNAYRSIFGVDPPGGSAPVIEVADLEMPIGDATAPIEVSDPDQPASDLIIEVDRDYDLQFDETLTAPELSLSYEEVGTHILKLRVTDATGRVGATLLRVLVVEPPPPDEEVDASVYATGGGGCAAARSAPDRTSFGAALALALAIAARARRRRR